MFNVHIQSKLLKRTLVTGTGTFAVSSVRVREKRWREWGGGGEGGACTGGYKIVRAVRLESVAGGRWFEVLWNLEMSCRIKPKRNMYAFQ